MLNIPRSPLLKERELFAWEVDFEDVVKQLNVSSKRLNALNELVKQGKVSSTTYEFLRKDFEQAVKSAEARKTEILSRLTAKLSELKDQTQLLEKCLTSTEVRFVAGELTEERYKNVSNALKLGLEESLSELESVQEAITILSKTGARIESAEAEVDEINPGGQAL
jgi:hypothetical protein